MNVDRQVDDAMRGYHFRQLLVRYATARRDRACYFDFVRREIVRAKRSRSRCAGVEVAEIDFVRIEKRLRAFKF